MFKVINKNRIVLFILTAVLALAIVIDSLGQCAPSAPAVSTTVTCTGCNTTLSSGSNADFTIGTYANTWCVPTSQTSSVGTITWTTGTLNVCGTLTVSHLTIGGGSGGYAGNSAWIYVGSGGSLTLGTAGDNATMQSFMGIANYGGTLVINTNLTMNQGSQWIITGTTSTASTSRTTFNGTMSISGAATSIVNRGTNTFNAATTVNNIANIFCFEKSGTVFNSTFTNSGATNPFQYKGSGTNDAVINFFSTVTTGGNPMSASGASPSNSNIKWCRNTGGTDLSANGNISNNSYSGSACANPLPVILSKFYAQPGKTGVDLIWVTAQEFNNDYFVLERSFDGINFHEVDKIKGQGTKLTPTTYIHNDEEVSSSDVIYYRLRQVDIDNQYENSPVIIFNNRQKNATIDIYPNPVEQGTLLYAKFGLADVGEAKISLFDLSGKLVSDYLLNEVRPGGIYSIDDKSLFLAKGTYVLEIKTSQNVYNQKLEVK